jgi:hypothetical protein
MVTDVDNKDVLEKAKTIEKQCTDGERFLDEWCR